MIKRTFPGPAGILNIDNLTNTQNIFSQKTLSTFQEKPWQRMAEDFTVNSTPLYEQLNISWLKKAVGSLQSTVQKIPFLAGIVESLELSDGRTQKYVNVTLKDKTGSIQGNITQSLYEEHAYHLTIGSVLVLTQFIVLSCSCDKCDNHHLTVTNKSLQAIYSNDAKIVVNNVAVEDILNEYQKLSNFKRKKKPDFKDSECGKSDPIVNSYKNSYNNNRYAMANSPSADPQRAYKFRKIDFAKLKRRNPTNINVDKTGRVSTIETSNDNRTIIFRNSQDESSPTTTQKHTSKVLSETVNSDSNALHNNNSLNECSDMEKSRINLNLSGNQISLVVENQEDGKLWKDALQDVDINSLFEKF